MIFKPDKDAARLYVDETISEEMVQRSEALKKIILEKIIEFMRIDSKENFAIDTLAMMLTGAAMFKIAKDRFYGKNMIAYLNPIILETFNKDKAYELIMAGEKIGIIGLQEMFYYYTKDNKIYYCKENESELVNWSDVPDGEFYIKKWRDEK